MSDKVTTFAAQPFEIATCTATVFDAFSPAGRVVSFGPTGDPLTLWCIHLLAPTTATGTSEENAMSFATHVVNVLNAGTGTTDWKAWLEVDGYYWVSYDGAGTASIVWTTSTKIQSALGFVGSLILTSADPAYAEIPPSHCIMSAYRPVATDGDYQPKFGFIAISRMQSGRVDVLKSSKVIVDRMFGLSDHPRTPADARVRATPVTPMLPDDNDHARWTDASAALDTSPGLWTIHRGVHAGMGLRLAYSLGNFQLLAGTAPSITYFNYGYWTEKTITSKVGVFAPPLFSTSKRDGLELTRMATPGTTT